MHAFDKEYWESHWQKVPTASVGRHVGVNPWLIRETADLVAGTALDAGCGEGAEAAWLAAEGWQVTAADISAAALARAGERTAALGVDPKQVRWVEADLSVWDADERFDLVTTFYAHAAIAQLAFYERIAEWVAPGGSLLIVGHDDHQIDHGRGHDHADRLHPPEEATAALSGIVARLDPETWDLVTSEQQIRTLANDPGRSVELRDVVVRAIRRP